MKHRIWPFVAALCVSSPSFAAFKCVDAEGSVSFSQTPCVGSNTSSQVSVGGGGAKSDPRACELAGLFAGDVARRMRAGSDYSREVERYGGTYGAKPAVVGVVNYIYSFKLAQDVPETRISSLTRAKCKSGGFGRVAFEDLPVEEYYIYDPNRQAWVRKGEAGGGQPSQPAQEPQRGSGYPQGALPAQYEASPESASLEVESAKQAEECERAKASLRQVDESMRSGFSASESNGLEERRRGLRDKAWSYCK